MSSSVLAGKAAFRSESGGEPFIVHVPKGALVDRGSEFSVNAGLDGGSDVLVFRENLAVHARRSRAHAGGARAQADKRSGLMATSLPWPRTSRIFCGFPRHRAPRTPPAARATPVP